MNFYILLPSDDYESLSSPNNVLGEVSFKKFYADRGFKALQTIIEKYPQVLNEVTIVDYNLRPYSVEAFLDAIKGLEIVNIY